jgi:hypothetical protein
MDASPKVGSVMGLRLSEHITRTAVVLKCSESGECTLRCFKLDREGFDLIDILEDHPNIHSSASNLVIVEGIEFSAEQVAEFIAADANKKMPAKKPKMEDSFALQDETMSAKKPKIENFPVHKDLEKSSLERTHDEDIVPQQLDEKFGPSSVSASFSTVASTASLAFPSVATLALPPSKSTSAHSAVISASAVSASIPTAASASTLPASTSSSTASDSANFEEASSDNDNDGYDSDYSEESNDRNDRRYQASDAFRESVKHGKFGAVLRVLYNFFDTNHLLRNPIPELDGIDHHLAKYYGCEEFKHIECLYALLRSCRTSLQKNGMTSDMLKRSNYYPKDARERLVVQFCISLLTPEQDRKLCEFFSVIVEALLSEDDASVHPLIKEILNALYKYGGHAVGGSKKRLLLKNAEMSMQAHNNVPLDGEFVSNAIVGDYDELLAEAKALSDRLCDNPVIQSLAETEHVHFIGHGSWAPFEEALGENYLSVKLLGFRHCFGVELNDKMSFGNSFQNGCAAASEQNPYCTEFSQKEIEDAQQNTRQLVRTMHSFTLLYSNSIDVNILFYFLLSLQARECATTRMNSFIVCDRNKNAWKTSDKLVAMLKAEGWTHVVGLPEDTVLMCVCARALIQSG